MNIVVYHFGSSWLFELPKTMLYKQDKHPSPRVLGVSGTARINDIESRFATTPTAEMANMNHPEFYNKINLQHFLVFQ